MPHVRCLRLSALASSFLAVAAIRAEAGSISFAGDFSALPAISTPSQIAVGQTLSQPFSGTIAGKGTASGSVVFQDLVGTGGSITITALTFQSALPAGANPSSSVFQITVQQDFALPAPGTLSASNFFAGFVSFTGPNQIASFGLAGSIRGTPGNPFQDILPTLSGGLAGPSSGPFPAGGVFDPVMSTLSGVPAAGPVTEILSLAAHLDTQSGASGVGSSLSSLTAIGITTRLTQSVPAPRSVMMMGIGLLAVIATGRHRGRTK